MSVSAGVALPLSAVTAAPLGALYDVVPRSELDALRNDSLGVAVRSRSPRLTNIGVAHINSFLEEQLARTELGRAIREADIVCLEHSHTGDYFDILRIHAERLGKKVVDIDPAFSQTTVVVQVLASYVAGAGSVWQLLEGYNEFVVSDEERGAHRRRRAILGLTTLGIAQLSFLPPTYLLAKKRWRGDGDYTFKYDVSLAGDARTVFITTELSKVIRRNPGKRVAVVTGDHHAVGIDYYRRTAPGQHAVKDVLYNAVYGVAKLLP